MFIHWQVDGQYVLNPVLNWWTLISKWSGTFVGQHCLTCDKTTTVTVSKNFVWCSLSSWFMFVPMLVFGTEFITNTNLVQTLLCKLECALCYTCLLNSKFTVSLIPSFETKYFVQTEYESTLNMMSKFIANYVKNHDKLIFDQQWQLLDKKS